MHQRLKDRLAGDFLNVTARDREPCCFQQRVANPQSASDKMVQGHAGNGDIAPMLRGRERQVVVALQRLECLDLEQRDLATFLGP